jgi:hypothetical protein
MKGKTDPANIGVKKYNVSDGSRPSRDEFGSLKVEIELLQQSVLDLKTQHENLSACVEEMRKLSKTLETKVELCISSLPITSIRKNDVKTLSKVYNQPEADPVVERSNLAMVYSSDTLESEKHNKQEDSKPAASVDRKRSMSSMATLSNDDNNESDDDAIDDDDKNLHTNNYTGTTTIDRGSIIIKSSNALWRSVTRVDGYIISSQLQRCSTDRSGLRCEWGVFCDWARF